MPEKPAPLEEQPWLPRPGENNLWYDRFSRYLAAGPSRSVRGVYNAEKGNERSKAVPASWTEAAHRFEWQRRAQAYDEMQRKVVFTKGYASDETRITKLNALAEKMYARLDERLAKMRVTDKFLAQYLAVLDMLAKHTGGYVQKHEVTGKDGKAIEIHSEEETTMRVVFYLPEIAPVEITPVDGDHLTLAGPGDGGELEQGEEAS